MPSNPILGIVYRRLFDTNKTKLQWLLDEANNACLTAKIIYIRQFKNLKLLTIQKKKYLFKINTACGRKNFLPHL